ncbi:MAG: hypothetical protein J6T84_04265 [Spirochaetaceae bacterium]|nr:hypothetical protein [Spirochaetaceae bacterium]
MENGRKVVVKAGYLYETTYTLNAWGEVVAVTDGMSNSRNYEYDYLGRTVAFYDGYNAKTEYAYNGIGRVEKILYPVSVVLNAVKTISKMVLYLSVQFIFHFFLKNVQKQIFKPIHIVRL